MSRLEQTLADYLRRIGQYEAQSLGKARRQVTAEDAQFLRDSLSRQQGFNNSILMVAVTLLCCLFLVGVFLILYNRDSVSAVAVISGTTFAALLAIVRFLRRLWLDKSTMDVLLHASYGMSPAESAKLVTSFYFKTFETSTKGSARTT